MQRPLTVLMADDDEEDRMLVHEAWEECLLANDLRFVTDGEELLDYLHRRGDYSDPADSPRPGLILLDLNMPRKDGREVLAELKADPKLQRIPVVVLTTSSAEADIVSSYDLHANCYIQKPVDFQRFISVVHSIEEFWLTVVQLPPTEGAGR